MLNKFFGNRKFYSRLLWLAVPIMIQNGITNFVNMLDNIMVGQVGTLPMTGVAISNQLIFVFNLCVFGAISGAGIFGAQFYGKQDIQGVKYTLRFKLLFSVGITLLCVALFMLFGDNLINMYLKGEGTPADIAETFGYAKEYLLIMLIGILPYSIAQCYAGTLRETGKAVLPMVAGVGAVIINLVLNYVLIYGKLGAPALGVKGAAIATVVSRFAELLVVVLYTHIYKSKNTFAVGLYRGLKVPLALCGQIFAKAIPLMVNETLWAAGIAVINQCYSVRGLAVVAATNISTTFYNVFSVAFMAVGMAVGILLGQQLGAGEGQKAKLSAYRSMTFSVIVSILVAGIYASVSGIIPGFYNAERDVFEIATGFMLITALTMPLEACTNAAYFTLRSGGKTAVTILFDGCFMWGVSVLSAFVLSNFTTLPILTVYFICQALNGIKCIIGCVLVKRGGWIKNIVAG